jgi:DNA-binding transcriptional MerR regulator
VPERLSLTIEQLAAVSGLTVRNIRAHRERGLLAPPQVRERIGYYGPDHVSRLALIQRLQADGFNLRAIEHLLEQTRAPDQQLLEMGRAVSVPFESEQPQVFTLAELEARFPGELNAQTIARAQQIGLLADLLDGRYEVPVPALLDAAEEAVKLGVSLRHVLANGAKLQEQCRVIAREFVRLFLDDLWKPFAQEGYPEERWSEMTKAVEHLRPLSSKALLGTYQLTMSREVEKAFGRELERLTGRKR